MNFKIAKHKQKYLFCCKKDFYVFYIKYYSEVYDFLIELENESTLFFGDVKIVLVLSKIGSNYNLNLLINNINYNFQFSNSDIGEWINLINYI
jgi:hypothetical protein